MDYVFNLCLQKNKSIAIICSAEVKKYFLKEYSMYVQHVRIMKYDL